MRILTAEFDRMYPPSLGNEAKHAYDYMNLKKIVIFTSMIIDKSLYNLQAGMGKRRS